MCTNSFTLTFFFQLLSYEKVEGIYKNLDTILWDLW
jgi:hypothetical protein